jgi:hypothetical protein
MWSSVIFCTAGRSASTRLNVNGRDSMRRKRVCSSASEVNTERGRLSTVAAIPSFQCGYPGNRSSTLARASVNSTRIASYPVISHGVLPSQIRTRLSWRSAPSAIDVGGGANGQPGARVIGNSGIMVLPR